MEWSPGWIFAIVTVSTGLAVIGIVRAAARRKRERRNRELVEAVTTGGFIIAECEEIPDDVPDWEIAPRRKRPGTAIRVQRANTVLWLFDYTQYNEGYLGWNEESLSGGDSGSTSVYRHTLACLHLATMALPDFQVIPNIRRKMESLTAGVARSVEAEGHALSGGALDTLMGAVGSLMAMRERPDAIVLTDRPELAAACKLYGADESAVRALATGPFGDLLLAHPGVILEGRGQWLIASMNVGVAFGFDSGKRTKLERGLLTPEQATDLVERTFEFAACLG